VRRGRSRVKGCDDSSEKWSSSITRTNVRSAGAQRRRTRGQRLAPVGF
jgi:hypothetical protein